jgi:hypothetical protein
MRPDAGDFTHQGESAATQWVKQVSHVSNFIYIWEKQMAMQMPDLGKVGYYGYLAGLALYLIYLYIQHLCVKT